jgi:hypothetical protein
MNLRDARQAIAAVGSDPDALSVFGQQYQAPDGATIIPVSKPVGVFVIKDGKPIWSPAADATRIALMGILVGLVSATLAGVAMVRRPPWPDLHGEVSKRLQRR